MSGPCQYRGTLAGSPDTQVWPCVGCGLSMGRVQQQLPRIATSGLRRWGGRLWECMLGWKALRCRAWCRGRRRLSVSHAVLWSVRCVRARIPIQMRNAIYVGANGDLHLCGGVVCSVASSLMPLATGGPPGRVRTLPGAPQLASWHGRCHITGCTARPSGHDKVDQARPGQACCLHSGCLGGLRWRRGGLLPF